MQDTAQKHKVQLYAWIRIWATLYVVAGHAGYLEQHTPLGGVAWAVPQNAAPVFAGLYRALQTANGVVYSFHMPLFFLLSGAVLQLRPLPPAGTLAAKRARRLLLPYAAVGYLYMFPLKLWAGFYTPAALPAALRSFVYSTAESGHLWFLPALFLCTLAFAGLAAATHRLGAWQPAVMLLLCAALQGGLAPRLPADIAALQLACGSLFWFAAGYFVLGPARRWLEKLPAGWAALLAVMVWWWLLFARRHLWPADSKVLLGCTAAVLLARACCALPQTWQTAAPLRVLERELFSVYLFHDPLNYVLLRIFMGSGLLASAGGCWLYAFCRTGGVLLASVALGEGLRAAKAAGMRVWAAGRAKA